MEFILVNKDSGDEFKIIDQMIIGRRSKCDLIISDELVSGYHCKISFGNTSIYIEDLKASNPVQVNGIGLDEIEKKKLKHNDKITIGSIEFIVVDSKKAKEESYQSMAFEKVKIHETFDSDTNYEENKKFWHVEKKQSEKVLKLEKRISSAKKSKDTLESLKNEFNQIQENLDSAEVDYEQYNLVELVCHIDKVEKELENLSKKKSMLDELRDEITIYENKMKRLSILQEKISKLEENYSDDEFKELTKSYNFAKEKLSKIRRKKPA